MDFLTAVPHKQGLEILKDELFGKIKKFSLVDTTNSKYYTDDVHRVFFDANGVLTITFVIPKDTHFTNWNKRVMLIADTGEIITNVYTPEIQFVTGVGGEQVLKLAVSGEAGEVVFKKDEYLTEYEAEQLFMSPIIESVAMSTQVLTSSLEEEIKHMEESR